MNGRLPHLILRAASLLTPGDLRSEWVKEWQSELWYVPRQQATPFCVGAFRDALDLRRNNDPVRPTRIHLESPLTCLAFLAILAVVSIFIVVRLPIPHMESSSALGVRELIEACIRMMLFSCVLLPGTVAVWRRPADLHPVPWRNRLCRGIFLCLKVALVQPIMLCGCLLLMIGPWGRFAGIGVYVAFIPLLRWLISDQQRRCPMCLRSLTAPVRIGTPSRTFLEWYGAESACAHGHGLLHISENVSSYSRKPQWLCLDDSWRELFAGSGHRDA
jgi:hypothetical protein